MMTGWTSGANADFNGYVYKGWSYDSGATALGARMDNSANSPWIHSIVTGDQYTLANVLRSYGRLMFVKHSGVWRTAWVDEINNGTNLRAGYVAYTAGTPGHVDNFKIIQLPAPFNTDYGLATDRLAGTISDGTLFTHEADCIIEWEVTTLATTNFAAVKFRAQNVGTDFWRVEAWDTGELKLREFIAGVGTVRATAAGGTVVSGDRILVVAEGETIRVYVNNVLKITYASAANFKTETAGEFQTAGTGGTVSDLVTWPRILSGAALEILDAVSGS